MAQTIVNLPAVSLDAATLRMECAKAIIDGFGIFASEVKEMPIDGQCINAIMMGAAMLLQDARDELNNELVMDASRKAA